MPNTYFAALSLLSVLALGGCVSAVSGDCAGLIKGNNGTFEGGNYSLSVPGPECTVYQQRQPGFAAVDFELSGAQKGVQHLYSMERVESKPAASNAAFQAYWKTFLPQYLTGNFGEWGHYETVFAEAGAPEYGANTFLFVGTGNHNDHSRPAGSIIGLAKNYGSYQATFYLLLDKPLSGNRETIKSSRDFADLIGFAQSFKPR